MKHPREGRRWTTRKNWAGSGWNVILRQDGRENARMSLGLDRRTLATLAVLVRPDVGG